MRRVLLTSCFITIGSVPLSAQQGAGASCCESVTPHVQAGIMTLHDQDGRARHEWLQAIVLWRSSAMR